MKPNFVTFTIFVVVMSLNLVRSDFSVTIDIINFTNPDGKLIDGSNCEFLNFDACDSYFNLCVESLANGASNDVNACNTIFVKTKRFQNQNTVTFSHQMYGNWSNPKTYPFSTNSPYQGIYFKLQAIDYDIFGADDIIDKLADLILPSALPAGQPPKTIKFTHPRKSKPSVTVFKVNVICSSGFQGPTCTKIPTTTTIQPTTSTSTSTTSTALPTTTTPEPLASCIQYRNSGFNITGVYLIKFLDINGIQQNFNVLCDMETDGGGWTVIQKRVDSTINFNRRWADYKAGFGFMNASFWLGNDKIHALTNPNVTLRIEVQKCANGVEITPGSAIYPSFSISNEAHGYRLSLGGISTGRAGDSFRGSTKPTWDQNGMQFSTFDRANNPHPTTNCAEYFQGGWWYNMCGQSNLNGIYYPTCYYTPKTADYGVPNGVYWDSYNRDETYYSYKNAQMKIR